MKYTLVLGYGWTGSSAAVDLLKEIHGYYQPNSEFRLIVDPHGLDDLRHHIVDQWDSVNCDYAIKEFKGFLKVAYRPLNKFQVGYNYKKEFGDEFLNISEEYLSNIISFMYRGSWIGLDFKKTYLELLTRRIMKRIPIIKEFFVDKMYYASMEADKFDSVTKEYINRLFQLNPIIDEDTNIVLDQAVYTQNALMAYHYFDNPKIIIIDRDPRDIYLDLIKCKGLIGRELELTKNTNMYVEWHKSYRLKQSEIKNNKDVLFLNFEDLVVNYTDTIEKIYTFLDIDPICHRDKKKYFDPDISRKNVGIWKDYKNSNEIKKIYEELGDYCYQGV